MFSVCFKLKIAIVAIGFFVAPGVALANGGPLVETHAPPPAVPATSTTAQPAAAPATSATTQPPPVTVAKVERLNSLEQRFLQHSGWTGGDGAYSTRLSSSRSIWLFGDTFVGTIAGGVRTKMDMVHNTAAWQSTHGGSEPFKFFWRKTHGQPDDLLKPTQKGKAYYWPSDAIKVGSKLAVFCKRIINTEHGEPGFDFKWLASDLLVVDNPQAEPTAWSYSHIELPGSEAFIFPGAAVTADSDFVYVYGTIERSSETNTGKRQCVLMRIPESALANGDTTKFEYWCSKINEHGEPQAATHWSKDPIFPVTLFDDAAPEMSVSKVPGLNGFFAVYTPLGLGDRILLRHADSPEGPWSAPLELYQCPEPKSDKRLLCYGAKNHGELDGERSLVITYCLNPGGLGEHRTRPYVYFPKAIKVTLRAVPADSLRQ